MMTVGVVFVSMGAWMLTWLQTGLHVFLSIKGHFADTPSCIAKFQRLEPATVGHQDRSPGVPPKNIPQKLS